MAKIQKRKTFSISLPYYDALTAYSAQLKIPISTIVERAVYQDLRDAGLLTDEDKKSTGKGKYWDPEIKRWRVPAIHSKLSR